MNEIFFIIIQILFSLLVLLFPINLIENSKKSKFFLFSLIDKLSLNLIFFANYLLLTSFFNININYIFIFYFILTIILYSVSFNKINLKKIKFNYYFILILFFIFLISLDLSHELYFSWDASRNWYFKALNFFQDKNIENLKNFHNYDYPHLGTFIWAFFWKLPVGNFEYEYLGRIFYVFIYTLSIFSIADCLKIKYLEKIIFVTLLISLTYKYDLFSGTQDILIFSFILFSGRFVYLFFDKDFKGDINFLIIILLALTNILFWIKNEGIFYSLFIVLSLLITNKLSVKKKLYLITGCFILVLFRIIIFKYYDIEMSKAYFQFGETLNFDFFSIIEKLKIIIFYMFVNVTRNLIYLITIPLLIYIVIFHKIKNITKFISYFFILNLAFVIATYLFKMTEVELLIKASMDRVLFQTSGIYLLIIVIFFNNYSSSLNKYKIK
tara:strand:+ start:823 stop:2142 length:1320 start_codon:yes stop_codon:yes gene_type:complete